jgi:hypothetical protein
MVFGLKCRKTGEELRWIKYNSKKQKVNTILFKKSPKKPYRVNLLCVILMKPKIPEI